MLYSYNYVCDKEKILNLEFWSWRIDVQHSLVVFLFRHTWFISPVYWVCPKGGPPNGAGFNHWNSIIGTPLPELHHTNSITGTLSLELHYQKHHPQNSITRNTIPKTPLPELYHRNSIIGTPSPQHHYRHSGEDFQNLRFFVCHIHTYTGTTRSKM